MRLQVQLMLPGCRAAPTHPAAVRVVQARIRNDSDGETECIVVVADLRLRWRSTPRAADRAAVALQGVVDLVLRWPFPAAQVTTYINSTKVDLAPLGLYARSPHEIASLIAGGVPMPKTVLVLEGAMSERIVEIAQAAFSASTVELDSLLGCFAQTSAAAGGAHPFDRVAPLWSGLELLHPGKGDLQRIDTITGTYPNFAAIEWPRGQDACAQLLALRGGLARDTWLYEAVRKRLKTRPQSRQQKLSVATVLAYAIRSLIVHGRWTRANREHREAARAAETWLWQLLERAIEYRVVGDRLPYLRSPATALYS